MVLIDITSYVTLYLAPTSCKFPRLYSSISRLFSPKNLIFFQTTTDRLSKMKVSCSSARVRTKYDVLGENHGQELLDIQQEMSKDEDFILDKEKTVANLAHNQAPTQEIETARAELRQRKLNVHPGFVIAFDNIDGKLERKHMTKENQNVDFHWVNHKVIINRVSGNDKDRSPKDVYNVPNIKFLPSVQDQKRQRQNYIVLVARILVDHLDCFAFLKDVCVRHIPHKYAKEMAKKSLCVSLTYVKYPAAGDAHVKQTGLLIILFRGVNFAFWSCLGCSKQKFKIRLSRSCLGL